MRVHMPEFVALAMDTLEVFLTKAGGMSFLSPANRCLAFMVLLDAYNWNEKRLANKYQARHQSVPLPENPTVKTEHVSIIVPTIDTEPSFTDSVRLWLLNNPKEIIIVTIPRDLDRVRDLVEAIKAPEADKIFILTVPEANKRGQMVRGIDFATGSVLALVDDDVFWPHAQVLPHLLAPLEDENIGAVGGPQKAHLLEARQDPDIVTAWETLALRTFDSQSKYNAVRMGADGGVWCLVGRTVLVRTDILQNDEFYDELANEKWFGKKLNTGDDVTVTRYIQHTAGWDVAIQGCPEAAVTTTIKRDSGFAKQMIRWQRSTLMMLLTHLFRDPGYLKLLWTHPYMARKMVERLIRPMLNYTYIGAWLVTLRNYPLIAFCALAYHLYMKEKGYKDFFRRYPYCQRYKPAVILFDYHSYILDPYIWLTIANDEWLTRNDSVARKQD